MAEGEKRIIRRRLVGSWLSTVISISLVLLLIGIASLLLVNARGVADYFKENMQVSVLLKQELEDDDGEAFRQQLEQMDCIKETRLITKEQGIREMAEMLGEDFLGVFEAAPVPVSIDVTLRAGYVYPDSLSVIRDAIGAFPQVDEVVYQQSLLEKLEENLKKISFVLGVFILLLLFISFVLIGNTIRLNVFSKRFTIHTMKLVGATKSFIRGPFLGQSVFQGLFSALIATILLVGVLSIIRAEFRALFEIFSLELLLWVIGIIVLCGILICFVSTYIVVGRLVSLPKDQLYY